MAASKLKDNRANTTGANLFLRKGDDEDEASPTKWKFGSSKKVPGIRSTARARITTKKISSLPNNVYDPVSVSP